MSTKHPFPDSAVVIPEDELRSFELLWAEKGQTLKKLSESFANSQAIRPSEMLKIAEGLAPTGFDSAVDKYLNSSISGFSVSFKGCSTYPEKMDDAKYPPNPSKRQVARPRNRLIIIFLSGHFPIGFRHHFFNSGYAITGRGMRAKYCPSP